MWWYSSRFPSILFVSSARNSGTKWALHEAGKVDVSCRSSRLRYTGEGVHFLVFPADFRTSWSTHFVPELLTEETNWTDGNLGLYHHMQSTPVQQVWPLYASWSLHCRALKTVSVHKWNVQNLLSPKVSRHRNTTQRCPKGCHWRCLEHFFKNRFYNKIMLIFLIAVFFLFEQL